MLGFGKKELDFNIAFVYPFNRAKGMLNILWMLLPIIGWFALCGYCVRIVQEFSNGKFKELPEMKFGDDFTLGFFMFLKSIPFVIAYMIVLKVFGYLDFIGTLIILLVNIFVIPMLAINFMNKETIESFFEFNILTAVWENLTDYTMSLLKSLLLSIIFLIMILVLVGLPAGSFTKGIFLADFYRRNIK